MSPAICQSFPCHGGQQGFRSFSVILSIGNPIVVAELELGNVPMQVLLGAMLIDTLHAPLEDREISLDGIGMDGAATVFPGCVADEIVIGELTT